MIALHSLFTQAQCPCPQSKMELHSIVHMIPLQSDLLAMFTQSVGWQQVAGTQSSFTLQYFMYVVVFDEFSFLEYGITIATVIAIKTNIKTNVIRSIKYY